MKFIIILFVYLSSFTLGIANPNISVPKVKSWESIATSTLNKKIQDAYKKNNPWAKKPELYIYHLFDFSEMQSYSINFHANSLEMPKFITFDLIRDRFLDDSVRGDIHKIKLEKNSNNTWNVISLKKAILCWRSDEEIYTAKSCL